MLFLREDVEDKLDRSFELARHENLEVAGELDTYSVSLRLSLSL